MEAKKTNGVDSATGNYYKDQLVISVFSMFCNCEIGMTMEHLQNLMYHATNPDAAKDLSKDEIAEMANMQMNLVHHISNVYMHYVSYFYDLNTSRAKRINNINQNDNS